jgi:hypothetical protein
MNYAQAIGIHSVAAAVVFVILYVPLLVFYVLRAVRLRTSAYITLVLFCASASYRLARRRE